MAAQRLPRGTRKVPARLGWVIEQQKKERLEGIATHAGVSAAVFLEAMIDHMDTEIDQRGLPEWWPTPEGLPINPD